MHNTGASRSYTPYMSNRILKRDSYTCVYCGQPGIVIDHVVPWSKGGKTIMANGVTCCGSCNMKKKGDLDEDFITKGLVHLARKGEDTSWVDELIEDTRPMAYLNDAQVLAVRLLLQADFEATETARMLDLSVLAVRDVQSTMRLRRKNRD